MKFLNFLKPKLHEGDRLLIKLESELAKTVADYQNSTHSGHPDEQLELIDDRRYWVARVKAAKDREWSLDKGSEYSTKSALHDWLTEIEPEFRGNEELKQSITAGFLTRIEWAEKGLI